MISEFERCLRISRREMKLSQGDLARSAGISLSDIAKLESGIFVPLENNTLCLLAKTVNTMESMFISMYHSVFCNELKQYHKEMKSGKEEVPLPAISEETAVPDTCPVLSPELMDIGKAIMAMPDERKKNLLQTIQMLVQAQTYSISTSTG